MTVFVGYEQISDRNWNQSFCALDFKDVSYTKKLMMPPVRTFFCA